MAKEGAIVSNGDWQLGWANEWNKVTSRIVKGKKIVMWKVERKTVAGQRMYEVYKEVTQEGAVIKRLSGGLFLTQKDAEAMSRRLNGLDQRR